MKKNIKEKNNSDNCKINILQYVPAYGFGGVESFTYELNRELKNNCNFYYLVEKDIDLDTIHKLESLGAEVIRIPNMTKESFWGHIVSIIKIFRYYKFDVIHVHDCDVRFFVMFFAKMRGVKNRIYHVHSELVDTSKKALFIKKIGVRLNVLLSNKCLACSENVAIARKIKKYEIIKNCIDVRKFRFNKTKRNRIRKEYCIPSENTVLLFVGRIERVKNVGFLVDVMKELNNNRITLMLVGNGSDIAVLKKSIAKERINNIVFVGRQNDLSGYYSAGDILCLPSFSEGFPITLLEAQANGLVCIVSKNVSKDVNICNRVHFLGIKKDDINDWIRVISRYSNKKTANLRNDRVDDIKKSGYDSGTAADIFLGIYTRRIKNNGCKIIERNN